MKMRKEPHQRFRSLVVVLALYGGFAWVPPAAAEVPGDVAAGIDAAGAAQDWTQLYAAVVAGLARTPALSGEILARARARAPAQFAEIETRLRRYFPDAMALFENIPVAAPVEPPASSWSGKAAVGGTRNTGNTRTASLVAGGLAKYERGRWRHIFDAEADFAQDDGRRTRQKFEAGAETNYDISDSTYVLGYIDFEHDKFSGFDYRVSEGVGLGYRIVDTDRLSISVEAGPGGRHSRVKTTGELQTELVARLSGELTWRITDSTDFTQSLSALIGQETTSITSRSALSIAINKSWKARLGYRVDHETNPPGGAKSTDTKTDVSLVYEF